MKVSVTRTIVREVENCRECPYFQSGHEGYCEKLEELDGTGYDNTVPFWGIPTYCPFVQEKT